MSGIVGSYFNTRGSGIVAKLGTDGQVFTSSGAGVSQDFEAAAGGGYWTLIKSITASSSATVSFVNGTAGVVFDNTYKLYMLRMIGVHPQTDTADFTFSPSDDTGSTYSVTKTVGVYSTYNKEDDAQEGIQYRGTEDSKQETHYQELFPEHSADADSAGVGELIFFDPSDTTHVKHFYGHTSYCNDDDYGKFLSLGGYFNTTSAIDAIQFKYSSGNIDAGQFILYGAD